MLRLIHMKTEIPPNISLNDRKRRKFLQSRVERRRKSAIGDRDRCVTSAADFPASAREFIANTFCFAGMTSMAAVAAAGLEVHEAGRALRVQTEAPHLVSMGSGRLSTAVTLHPLPEGYILQSDFMSPSSLPE